jgi:peptidoglycan/LPS O-acetylase OafA/YrhL
LIKSTYSDVGSPKPHYPALDGLRGLAIILVLLFHNFRYIPLFEYNWVGVDLFFVISGFLITGILLRERNTENYPQNFYVRRILRIFPIYYFSLLLLFYLLPRSINYSFNTEYFFRNQKWFWFFGENWLFIVHDPGNKIFLAGHFWTLALEEQFYILFPWIILLVKNRSKLISLLLAILSLLFIGRLLIAFLHMAPSTYSNLYEFTRFDGLCIGALLAALLHKKTPLIRRIDKQMASFLILGIVALLIICPIFNWRLPLFASSFYPMIAIFWGLVVRSSLVEGTFCFSVFNNPILKFFGKISYGVYIFHWPVYKIMELKLREWLMHEISSTVGVNLTLSFLAAIVAVLIALASYYWFENKFLKLKRFFA